MFRVPTKVPTVNHHMQTRTFSKFVRPEEPCAGRITDRDLEIIETILRYRFIPTSELVRLVGGNEDVTLRRLRRSGKRVWSIILVYHLSPLRRPCAVHEWHQRSIPLSPFGEAGSSARSDLGASRPQPARVGRHGEFSCITTRSYRCCNHGTGPLNSDWRWLLIYLT